MAEDVLRNSPLSLKLAALRVVDLPLSVFSSFPQVSLSAGTKKLVAATAFGAVSLALLARHFRRRKGRKKSQSQREQEPFDFLAALPQPKDVTGGRQNLSLSLSSKNGFSCHVVSNGSLYSKLSGSLQSLASVKSMNSCSSCTCPNGSSCWDRADESELRNIIPVTTPENLYLMGRGMELFEEALRRWEQALTFRSRLAEDEASCASVKLGAGDAIAEESVEDIISAEFIHKLESLLQRAYRLQEEFEGALGMSDHSSHPSNGKAVRGELDR
ncbi:hypothetical protein NFI96_030747 [Prochilodus magdalenae]|nr:hypothetical protein NFI96_030747 [Prochilodus magdalenae]